jgi:hypothetical protein
MRLTFDLGLTGYRQAITSLITHARADAKQLLREEARLLLRDILEFTPPRTLAQGRAAIARDLSRVYATPERMIAEAGRQGDHGLAVALAQAYDAGQRRRFMDLLRLTQGGSVAVNVRSHSRGGYPVSGYSVTRRTVHWPIRIWAGGVLGEAVDPSHHLRRRNRYGRVRGDIVSQLVWREKSLLDYARRVQGFVGWAKAGWLRAAELVGLQLPKFVTRHPRLMGGVLETPLPNASITLVNRSSAIPGYQATVDAAVRRRHASLIAEAQRILPGGKSRRA